jgi:hypothetical protein
MNKKILISILLIASFATYAEDSPFQSVQNGIQIIPIAKQTLPISMKNKMIANEKELSINGYLNTSDHNASYLLNLKRNAPELKKYQENKYGELDTSLKQSYKEIKLKFPFVSVKGIPQKNIIGYAAIGSFDKDKGWNGIKEFFNSELIGTCAYSRMEIIAVQLTQETTEFLVNKKPSNKIIEGNMNDGFVYSINWYTDSNMYTLECANKNYNQEIMTHMISLANIIDKK